MRLCRATNGIALAHWLRRVGSNSTLQSRLLALLSLGKLRGREGRAPRGSLPTLRDRDELLSIVERISSLGMRPTLMTNGIRASRSLLTALSAHGLVDVVF